MALSALAAPGTAAPHWHIAGTTSGNLTSLVAPSTRSQWAFGGRQLDKPTPPVALRHSGSRWVQAALPAKAEGRSSAPGRRRLRTYVLSPTDVWAFGSTGAGLAIGTWHLHGSTWTHMTSYPADVLGQASVVSRNDIWATGWDGIEGILAHWNGSTWKADPSLLKALPRQSSTVEVQVRAVTATSSRSLWVEALVDRETDGVWHNGTVVEHGNGAKWTRVAASSYGYYLPVAVPDGHGGWWSAGYPASGPVASSMTYLLHGSRGHWAKVALPKARHGDVLEVSDIANVPGARTAYAVADEVSKATGLSSGVILKVTY